MPRPVLPEAQIHPAVREKIASYRSDMVKEVQAAVQANDIVVVGMRMNPFPKKARKALDAAGLAYKYLEYGSYLGEWRRGRRGGGCREADRERRAGEEAVVREVEPPRRFAPPLLKRGGDNCRD